MTRIEEAKSLLCDVHGIPENKSNEPVTKQVILDLIMGIVLDDENTLPNDTDASYMARIAKYLLPTDNEYFDSSSQNSLEMPAVPVSVDWAADHNQQVDFSQLLRARLRVIWGADIPDPHELPTREVPVVEALVKATQALVTYTLAEEMAVEDEELLSVKNGWQDLIKDSRELISKSKNVRGVMIYLDQYRDAHGQENFDLDKWEVTHLSPLFSGMKIQLDEVKSLIHPGFNKLENPGSFFTVMVLAHKFALDRQ